MVTVGGREQRDEVDKHGRVEWETIVALSDTLSDARSILEIEPDHGRAASQL